jgi:hypothetical protein
MSNSFNMKDKMKRQSVFFAAAVCGLMTLASCAEEVMNEQTAEPNSRLCVETRSGSQEVLALPVQFYIFDASDKCVAAQTIESGTSMTPVWLPEGAYTICAIGGADDTSYTLPSQETATPETAISLKENQSLTDLMAFSTQVDLADGAQEDLSITLERQVLKLKGITIRDVPDTYTSVSVQISKLYETLLLNGTPSGSNGSITVNLTQNQTDNKLWELEDEAYLLPSNGKPTITVSFKTGSETKSYVYACKEELPANYKLTIDGTYNATQGVTISGTISGAVWSGEKTIALTFNERDDNTTGEESTTDDNSGSGENSGGGSTTNNDDVNDYTVLNSLSVGDVYQGCYVLEKTAASIKLLSATEGNGITSKSALTERINNWSVENVTATWRIPTLEEIDYLKKYNEIANAEGVLPLTTTKRYYCQSGNTIYTGLLSTGASPNVGTAAIVNDSYKSDFILRPVAEISLNN